MLALGPELDNIDHIGQNRCPLIKSLPNDCVRLCFSRVRSITIQSSTTISETITLLFRSMIKYGIAMYECMLSPGPVHGGCRGCVGGGAGAGPHLSVVTAQGDLRGGGQLELELY